MEAKSNKVLENILRGIIVVGSFLVVLVPIIIVPGSYFPYIIQKTIILRILIEIIFGVYIILALWKPEYRPKKSILLWSVLAFAAVMLLTTFTGQSLARSWWGNWERSFGTFLYLHFFAWFIILISVFNNKELWNKILNLTLFVSLFISLYAIAQRLGLPITYEAGLQRVNGTMGNASYLATYLLLHLFIALLFFVERTRWKSKLYYLSVFVIDFFVLTLTGTRGALLALMASVVTFIILVFWLKVYRQRTFKLLLVASFLLFIGIGVLFIFKDTSFVKQNYWFKRLTSYSLEDNTIQTRLHSWSWGLKGFRDNLLVGVGPENYQNVFNQYFEGDFYNYSRNEIWFDRAHNTLIDMAVTMGIFGFLSYLFIFGVIIYYLFNLQKRKKISSTVFIILSLLFLSYFFQNLFVFDSINSLIVFYLVLVFVLNIYSKNQEQKEKRFKELSPQRRIPPYITTPVVLLLFLILLFGVNLPEAKANLYVYDAFVGGKMNQYTLSVDSYLKTYEVAINKIDPAILLSTSLNEMIGKDSNIAPRDKEINDLELAIEWMDKAIELDNKNMFLYYIQAKNYSLLAELTKEMNYVDKGVEFALKAQQLSPGRVRPLWILGQLYLFAGQFEKSIFYLNEAVKKNEKLPETYFYRAVVYENMGDEENMYRQYDALIDLEYEFILEGQVLEVINHYQERGDSQRFIYLLQQLTILEPNDPNNWNNLVNAYEVYGQYDRALSTLKKWSEALPGSTSSVYRRYQEILDKKNETVNEN